MGEKNDESSATDGRDPARLDPDATVVVSTASGDRFHRPDGLGYETACKTGFKHPIRKLTASEAERRGFTPCRKSQCFGDADD